MAVFSAQLIYCVMTHELLDFCLLWLDLKFNEVEKDCMQVSLGYKH